MAIPLVAGLSAGVSSAVGAGTGAALGGAVSSGLISSGAMLGASAAKMSLVEKLMANFKSNLPTSKNDAYKKLMNSIGGSKSNSLDEIYQNLWKSDSTNNSSENTSGMVAPTVGVREINQYFSKYINSLPTQMKYPSYNGGR